ncbi:MAG: peptide deformylase [Actinobacteria bacterium]|jgi:peptide deformylase|nr:peptide deformylase [Actinomycetota bacterium]
MSTSSNIGVVDTLAIRIYGDVVLRKHAAEVTDVDGNLVHLAEAMIRVMHEAPGVGLAAPQVGVSKRIFTYDIGDDSAGASSMSDKHQGVIINPVIEDARGEWTYEEGCLSVPGLSWWITRPKEIHVTGYDLSGNHVSIEADELFARVLLHEIDHLDGVLLMDRLDQDQRKAAMKAVREKFMPG